MAKLNFQHYFSSLQRHMIFPAQETFLNLNVENSFFFQDCFMNRKLEQDLFDV